MEEWIILHKMVKTPSDEGKVVKVDKETYERIVDVSEATSIPIQRLVTRFINAALEHTKIINEEE